MKRIFRSRKKVIAGVCQGFSDYIGMDVSLWRIFFIFGTVFTVFPFIIFYMLCWIAIPLEEKSISTQ